MTLAHAVINSSLPISDGLVQEIADWTSGVSIGLAGILL